MKKRTFSWILGIIAVLLAIGAAGFGYIHSAVDNISSNHSAKDERQIAEGKPLSVLLLGTDDGALGRKATNTGNTDTMELMTVNPQTKQVTITAIPRDTLVKVNTSQGTDYVKINAAYALGGAKLAKEQVSELLDVPVQYYALVNMGMLEKVVNAVDGVEVNNPFKFTFQGHTYPQGMQYLNGSQALGYARMRYDDPDNDYGRQKRGQQILMSAFSKFSKSGNLFTATKLVNAVKDDIKTDIPLDNFAALYNNYVKNLNTIHNYGLRGKDAKISGLDFQIATSEQINKASKIIRQALGLKPVHVVNNETKLVDMQTSWDGINNLNFTLPDAQAYQTVAKTITK
ncbi:LCP family protein required for cell wall assembly [Lactobacillus colini]|uniref:LCP family protein required for cell wall assembly n=1 Tax=Lactobacillus colini TaxID=1819254 RepID=A0ABS4MH09_9LACO|nr:LCP family protein required for cell wall assembly [Lactobacillus colini]